MFSPRAWGWTAWGRWVQAERKLEKDGPVLTSGDGNLYQSPWLHVANKAWEQMRKILPEFGLTPSSRSRLKINPPNDELSLAELLFAEATGLDVQVSDE